MTLAELEAFGAYVVAGWVDLVHEGRHKRVAYLNTNGTVDMTPEGEALFLTGVGHKLEALTAPDGELAEEAPKRKPGRPRKVAAEAPVEAPVEAPTAIP